MGYIKNYIFPNTNLLDLTLYQYGIEECDALHLFGPAIRNHYLLHFVTKGKGSYHINDSSYELEEGQAFLIPPGVPTTYYADEKNPWTYTWIEFDGLKASEYLKRAGLSAEMPVHIPKESESEENPGPVYHMKNILKNHGETTLRLIAELYLLMDALIKYSSNTEEEKPGTLKDFYMKEAVHYIEEHYAEDITIEDLAAWCSLNRSYFSKLFKDSLKITPQEFLMRYRMGKACSLLSHTNTPINEIAAAVGYKVPLHFSRAFKTMYGISPRTWRINNRY